MIDLGSDLFSRNPFFISYPFIGKKIEGYAGEILTFVRLNGLIIPPGSVFGYVKSNISFSICFAQLTSSLWFIKERSI